jgi:hypothetical protein
MPVREHITRALRITTIRARFMYLQMYNIHINVHTHAHATVECKRQVPEDVGDDILCMECGGTGLVIVCDGCEAEYCLRCANSALLPYDLVLLQSGVL